MGIAASAVIGRNLTIRPEQYDRWTVVPNLWGAIVGPPAVLKTHALGEATSGACELAAAARERHEADKKSGAAHREVAEGQIKAKRQRLGNKGTSDAECKTLAEEVVALKAELDVLATGERRYLTSDATIEKLGEILAANPRGRVRTACSSVFNCWCGRTRFRRLGNPIV